MCEVIIDVEKKLAGFYDGIEEDIELNDKLGKLIEHSHSMTMHVSL